MGAAATNTTIDLRLAVSEDVVGDYPVKLKCREHNDKFSSLAVYRTNLHCFGCGFHEARTIDALAYLLKVSVREAISVASKYTAESLDAYRERAATESRRDPMPASLSVIYNEVLMGRRKHRLNWLKARGLTNETLDLNNIGHDGMRFVIPVFDGSWNLISLRYRRDDMYMEETAPKYCGTKGRNGFYIYPEHLIANTKPEYLVLCEGELDTLRLWQEGIPAVTATNGAGQAHKVIAYIKEHYPSVKRFLVATDMDEPGREAARIAAEEVEKQGFEGAVLEWSEGKDVTEAMALGSLRPEFITAYATGA